MRNLFLKAAVKFTCPCARPSVENASTPLKCSSKPGLLLTSKNSILCVFFLIQSDYLAYFSISKIQKLPNTPKGFPRINLPSCCCQEQVLALPKFRLEGGGIWLYKQCWLHYIGVIQETPLELPSGVIQEKRNWYERNQGSPVCVCSSPKPYSSCLLCFSGDNAGQAPSRDPEKASGSRKDHLQVLRTTYLNDVKKTLDKSTFSHFYEALLTYKKTDDYDAMIPVIAALTTERPEDFHLLRSKGYFKAIII